MHQCDKIRQVLQPGSSVLGCSLHFHFRPSESETTVLQKTWGDTTLQTKVRSAELYIKCLRGEPRGNFACNLQLSLWKNCEENFVKMSSKVLMDGHVSNFLPLATFCHGGIPYIKGSSAPATSGIPCQCSFQPPAVIQDRDILQIFLKNQACTCLTKTRHRSAAFVP